MSIYIYIRVCVCVSCVCICVHIYVYIYVNIYIYVCVHIVKARPVHMCMRSFPHLTRGFFQKPVVAAASGLEGGISLSNSAISDA